MSNGGSHSGVAVRGERLVIATAFAAMVASITGVSLAAMGGRAVNGRPFAPVAVAVLVVVGALAAGWWGRYGAGPVAQLAARLPPELDGSFARHRVRGVVVAALLILAVLQLARLSCFMADDTLRWGSAFPPATVSVKHMCLASYVQAADLTRQDDQNIYDAAHYPSFAGAPDVPVAVPPSPVANIEPYIQDPYHYPPPFLLVPRLMLLLSNDYMVHRTGWFLVQALAFLAFALWLVTTLDAPDRAPALALLVALVAWTPVLLTWQFGQWHLAAILAAMGGMALVARGRDLPGGALLAASVVTKIFPGLLLIVLLMRKRWRALGFVAAFACLFALMAWLVVGSAPYVAFVGYELPRMASGEAFSYFLRNDISLAGNYGVYGLPFKLERLGLPGVSPGLASGLTWAYSVLLLGLAVVVGRKRPQITAEPALWLALLVLASLRSPLAPSAYAVVPALWLLTLKAREVGKDWRGVGAIILAFIVMGGMPPMPSPKATIALWMLGQAAMLLVGFWVVLRREGVVDAP